MNTNLNQTENELILYWVHLPEHTEEHLEGYIGVTNDFETRMNSHRRKAPNKYFQHAIRKYGWDNLVKEVIVRGPEKDILELEQMFRPKERIGWNLAIGGGKPPSIKEYYNENPEAREAMVESKKAYYTENPWVREAMSERTKAQFAESEAREAMSGRLKAYYSENPEARRARSERKKAYFAENPEAREAMSERAKAQFADPEAREAMSGRLKAYFAGNPEAGKAHSERIKALPKKLCEHCGKSVAPGMFARWHGDNCKHNPNNKD